MKKILALSAALVPFALAACTSPHGDHDSGHKKMSMADSSKMTLDVSGMT